MFEINLLNQETYTWEPLLFNGTPMQFSSKETLFRALKNTLGTNQQILYNGCFFDGLNGTIEQYDWFKRSFDRLMNKYKHYHCENPIVSKVKVKMIERKDR